MKIRPVSDIHTEFFGEDEIADASLVILPALPDDAETVLVLAGDIGSMSKPECLVNFINAVVPRFNQVLYIPGNHEYYHGDINTTPDRILELTAAHDNLYFTEYGGMTLDFGRDLYFHMHTLWTDFDRGNDKSMTEAQYRMNDYRLIANGDRVLQAMDTYTLHKYHKTRLQQVLQEGEVVVTHHSPSLRSIPEEYLTDRVNGAYHSDLIEEKKPALWIHGHTHTACDYMQGSTRILCNPRGYGRQHKGNGYRPTLVVEL